MNTNLTLNQIECALAKYFDIRKNIIVCNVSHGLLDYEADMIIMSKSGYLTEIEIKRSLSDLRADFKKNHSHDDNRIKHFYYCIPESIVDECAKLCVENNRNITGIIKYSEDGCLFTITKADLRKKGYNIPFHFDTGVKLFLEEQLQLARLGAMRVWNYKNKES